MTTASTATAITSAEHEALKAHLQRSQDRQKEILESYDDLASTNADYEDVMASMMIKVREFSHSHTTTLISWHEYYNSIIQNLRDESLQKSLEHAEWQERAGRLNTYVRAALSSYSEESNPLYDRISYLKRENRIMRSLLGWPRDPEQSDDDEQDPQPLTKEEVEEMTVARKMLRDISLKDEEEKKDNT